MSDIAERYRRRAGDFALTLRDVPADRWSSPSPCEGWTARDVVRHVVDSHVYFLGRVGLAPDAVPGADDDPVAAFDHVRSLVQGALDDPGRAAAEYDSPLGRQTFQGAVDRFLCTDLVVHRWDVGTAAGLPVRLPDEEIDRIRADMGSVDESMLRSAGAFGAAVEAPPDADEQTRLLAFLGRRA